MKKEQAPEVKKFPWLLLILLLGSLYVFWVLPFQLGSRPVRVEFEPLPGAETSPATNP